MDLLTIFIIAVGLGVDAFSVAIGIGAANIRKSWTPVLRLACAFGLFQFVMPIIGWLAGLTVVNIISGYDHWIAFALLSYIGVKMIRDAFREEKDEKKVDRTKGMPLLLLSIATSIDALAVGFSFSLLKISMMLPSIIIGIVCFAMTVIGMFFGKGLAKFFGRRVEIFGGVVLIAIGVKILTDHIM
jgi:manganese efflux pump family protein